MGKIVKFGEQIIPMSQSSKVLTLLAMTVVLPLLIHAQSIRPLTKHNWIKIKVENLSDQPVREDTTYTRYTFDGKTVKISFYPGWNEQEYLWSYSNAPFLAVGFQTYILEEMTDSTMVFYAPEYRRFRFLSEEAFKKLKVPDTTARFNDHTVYVADNYLTPRCKTNVNYLISSKCGPLKIGKKAITFQATFIVTDKGKVDDVKIINGISEGYDAEFIKQIKKTSGDWTPAKVGENAVYSQMSFEVKYLDSFGDPNMGHIN
jgi:hypothetical protein